ncbi:hypothetical protein EJG51_009650 [Undibacterium piscinae]|uniref:Uncharacterized protein n=1 Tax=Undibacterium piscinae TaxID=2495591 RepID=A0A6M4A423_9BURK|nr:hypothetical protein EJG51_009650 [Undibacterium piscinae]
MKAVFDKRIIWGLLATLPLIGVLLFSSKKAETADAAQAQAGNAALTVTVSVPLSSSWNTSLTHGRPAQLLSDEGPGFP